MCSRPQCGLQSPSPSNALSWPAVIKSIEARQWSAALISLVALALAGSYSVTAALGSAAGGRTNAAAVEHASTDARTKAQAAYDDAKRELDGLKPSRPVAELEAFVEGAKPQCRIVVATGYRNEVCGKPPALVAELARARRRAELEGKMERATAELATAQPTRVAKYARLRDLLSSRNSRSVGTTTSSMNCAGVMPVWYPTPLLARTRLSACATH
jgi:hypothetical protein